MMFDWTVFFIFIKLGFVGFGGGYAILALLYSEIEPLEIMDIYEFQDLIAISQITPGPVVINTATYVGYLIDGWPGAIIDSIALCIPGMLLMYIIVILLNKGQNMQAVNCVLEKVRIAGIVLLIISGIFIAEGTLIDFQNVKMDILQMFIFAISLIVSLKFKPGPVKLILAMGLTSVVLGLGTELII